MALVDTRLLTEILLGEGKYVGSQVQKIVEI